MLDNHNKVRPIRPADAQPHKKSATAVALDAEQQTVGNTDIVRVTEGPYKGKTGLCVCMQHVRVYVICVRVMYLSQLLIVEQQTFVNTGIVRVTEGLHTGKAGVCVRL